MRKVKRKIRRLQDASRQAGNWADHAEKSKIGYDKRKANITSSVPGLTSEKKSRKMQMRRKNLQRRQEKAIEEKEKLLKKCGESAGTETDAPEPLQGSFTFRHRT